MAITTYNELVNSVTTWLARSDLTAAIPSLIELGETRIKRQLVCREMETALSGTIASGVLAVPADYLALKYAYIEGTPVSLLQRSSASQVLTKYPLRTASGKPTAIARDGNNFIFGPFPGDTYTVGGIYYADPGSVVDSAHDTFLAHPDLYLFAALVESAPLIKDDPRVTLWEAKYNSILEAIRSAEADEYSSGGGMTVRAA